MWGKGMGNDFKSKETLATKVSLEFQGTFWQSSRCRCGPALRRGDPAPLLRFSFGIDSRNIRACFFKTKNCLARFRVTQSLASHPFDSLGIVPEGINRRFQTLFIPFLDFNLSIQIENAFSHALVLLDVWEVPDRNPQDPRQDQKKNDHAS